MLKTSGTLLLAALVAIGINIGTGTTLNVKGKHTLYFYKCSSECRIVDVDDGNDLIYFKSDLKGESVRLDDKSELDGFLKSLRAVKVFDETVGEILNEYYYSPQIKVYKTINGHKVNVHTATEGEKVIVGVPLIFGSY